MPIEPVYLLYGAIFLGVLLLTEGLFLLIADRRLGRQRINKRIEMLDTGTSTREVLEILRRRSTNGENRPGLLRGMYQWLDNLITQTGVTMTTSRLLLIMSVLCVVVFFATLLFLKGGVLPGVVANLSTAAAAAVLIGFGFPVLRLVGMRQERVKKFSEQLPDTLDIMARSLRAGHPISAAMDLVTREMPDPIGSEFGLAVDEMTYGLDLNEALEKIGARINLPDFQFVVVAINIQHETGGNLAEILSSLATIIRDRFRMIGKVRALSSEGRISAIILSVLPVITVFTIYSRNPDFYLNVIDDPLFMPIALGIFMLMLTGIYIMYRLVNFRV